MPSWGRSLAAASADPWGGVLGGGSATSSAGISGAVPGSSDLQASGGARASLQVGAQASTTGALNAGMTLKGSGGEDFGHVINVVRTRAGQVRTVTIETIDGVKRTIPAGAIHVQGDVAVTSYSSTQLRNLPQAR